MRKEGLEPSRISPPEPKSGASTNSATLARGLILKRRGVKVHGIRPSTPRSVERGVDNAHLPVNAAKGIDSSHPCTKHEIPPVRRW